MGTLGENRASLLKFKVEAERLTTEEVPVPVKVTACGLPGALSVTVSVAFSVEANVGLNVKLIMQLPLTATELGERGQVVVTTKSLAFEPVIEMFVKVKLVLPALVRVII